MELSGHTPTELLKLGNDTSAEHERLKKEIVDDTYQIDELEKVINEKLEKLKELESQYVEIIAEIDKR